MTTLIISLSVFYALIIIACVIIDNKVSRTMGIDSKGELVWMKKKEIKRLKKQKDYIYH